MSSPALGSLTVVGTGYRVGGHLTTQTEGRIRHADHVLFLVSDPATAICVRGLNPNAESLHDCYREGESGLTASKAMVDRIMEPVRAGREVCAVFYGHPAVFMHTSREALRHARDEGHRARMLPGVSAEDCLIADLGIDPAVSGRLIFEATDFVTRPRTIDTSALLILLQIGAVGVSEYRSETRADAAGLEILVEVLGRYYPAGHEVFVYETPQLPLIEPVIRRIPLSELPQAGVTVISTLCVPPLGPAPADPAMMARLGIRPAQK